MEEQKHLVQRHNVQSTININYFHYKEQKILIPNFVHYCHKINPSFYPLKVYTFGDSLFYQVNYLILLKQFSAFELFALISFLVHRTRKNGYLNL